MIEWRDSKLIFPVTRGGRLRILDCCLWYFSSRRLFVVLKYSISNWCYDWDVSILTT